MVGAIFNVQRFCVHDGQGTRTVVFLKGCNLRCYWCHNPEGMEARPQMRYNAAKCIGCGRCTKVCPAGEKTALFTEACTVCGKCAEVCYAGAREIVGRTVTAEELAKELAIDKDIFDDSGGGVTLSGGEPLLQADFVQELCCRLKEKGISVAVETAGCVDTQKLLSLVGNFSEVFCDIKSADEEKHRAATGRSNRLILENIRAMSAAGVMLRLRVPVIPGFNDTGEDAAKIAEFVSTLPKIPAVELLPFHGVCVGKYRALGMKYAAEGKKTPSQEILEGLTKPFIQKGIEISY